MAHRSEGTGVQNQQRLAALHRLGLLDSPAEPGFDRLTRLVVRLLNVPVALVSLLDVDRQYFKSSVGLPEPWATSRETPLSHSFCQYVVDSGELLAVEDAPNHSLVCTNLAIPDMNVQAYLGFPLTTRDGMVFGSLCAIDTVPRPWHPEDFSTLRDLAALVVNEIELRRDLIERQQAEAALYESDARFSGAFRHASIGMAIVGLDGRWLQVNPAVCALTGYSEPELRAITFQQLTHPDDLESDLAYVELLLCGEINTYQMEKRYYHKRGHTVWVRLNVSLVRDLTGEPQYFVSQIQDVTDQRHHEYERGRLIDQLSHAVTERDALLGQVQATLRRSEALYDIAATLNRTQAMPEILRAVVSSAAQVLPASRTVLITVDVGTETVFEQIEGGPGAIVTSPLTFAELWDGLTGVALRTGQPVFSTKDGLDPRESPSVQARRQRDRAGSIMVVPLQSQGVLFGTLTAINAPNQDDFGSTELDLLTLLANQAAVAIERGHLLTRLQLQATVDALTQLLNRRSWLEQSERAIALAQRSRRPASVVLLDIDHFKQINDTYGHLAGDVVLRRVSQLLRQSVRRSDLVGRYGGEEFVLLLPETDAATAGRMADRIRRTIAVQQIPIEGRDLAVTVSLGVASLQWPALDLMALVAQADSALYAAKHAGRNCVQISGAR